MADQKKNKMDAKGMFVAWLEQAAGESASAAAKKYGETKVAQDITEWAKRLMGTQGVIETINFGIGTSTLYLRNQGWDPVFITPLIAVVDDFFDGVKEVVRESGKATPEGVQKAYEAAIQRNRSFPAAYRNLDRSQRLKFSRMLEEFLQDDQRAARWKIWREKIENVQTLRDLLATPTPEGWIRLLTTELGDANPPKTPVVVGFFKEILPSGSDIREAIDDAAGALKKGRQQNQRTLRSMRNRKKYG